MSNNGGGAVKQSPLDIATLKPCPFCGTTELVDRSWSDETGEWYAMVGCPRCATFQEDDHLRDDVDTTRWNERPIEDALQAKADALARDNAALASRLSAAIELLQPLERFQESAHSRASCFYCGGMVKDSRDGITTHKETCPLAAVLAAGEPR